MKSRLLYFFISGIIILSIFLGIFIWHNNKPKEIPNLDKKSYAAPISSKYITTNADLVLHWKINPNKIPNYIENYQDQIKLIRDSSFNLIGLDFTKNISNWAGEHGSFAIFDTTNKLFNDWLLILEVNEDVNNEEALKLILEPTITDENINSINKLNILESKIISRKINSNTSIYISKEKQHILISSNPEIIKSSTSQSGINKSSKRENYKKIKLTDKLNDGILSLEISPRKIFNRIGQEEDLLEINQADKLITSINIYKNKLIFEGVISYTEKSKRPIKDQNSDFINIKNEYKLFNNLILIDNPEKYFGNNNPHPYQEFIASLIQKSISKDFSNLFKIILEKTKGNLIWLMDKDWLAITEKDNTSKEEINGILEDDKFLNSKLEFKNKNLEVWSKITANKNSGNEIEESIKAIIEENEKNYIWSQDISSILSFDNKKYFSKNLETKHEENENNEFDDIIKIHLGKKETQLFLSNFYPYVLIKAMTGNKLDSPQNIDISVAIPTINYTDFIKFKVILPTS